MRRHRRRPGDDAVSPVVGVVLIVGIAVMLMTTVGIFVLGFGPGEPPPEASVQFHQESGPEVTISVVEPDDLREEHVEVRVNGSDACYAGANWNGAGALDTGDTVTVDGSGTSCTPLTPGDTIRVVWESPSGDRSAIVGEYEVL